MTMEDKIKAAVESAVNVQSIEIINESYLHQGHAGDDGSGETHYKLMIVSCDFNHVTKVQQHRIINAAIQHLFTEGLHAISMKLSCAGAA